MAGREKIAAGISLVVKGSWILLSNLFIYFLPFRHSKSFLGFYD